MRRGRHWSVALVALIPLFLLACASKPTATSSSQTSSSALKTSASPTAGSASSGAPAPRTNPLQGTWHGKGTYNNGQAPFDMVLTIQSNGLVLTGTLQEDTYDGTVAVSGEVTSASNRRFTIRFTDYASTIGTQIALNCIYVATVANGHMTGSWNYPGDASPDGTLTLDLQPGQASGYIETSYEQQAVAWAKSLIGSSQGQQGGVYWIGCLAFAFNAYEQGANFPIRNGVGSDGKVMKVDGSTYPVDIWPVSQSKGDFLFGVQGTSTTPPFGALVFWDSTGGGNADKAIKDSHVAISIGGGQLVSTNVAQRSVSGYDGIHIETMAQFAQNSWNIYKGWWLPDQ